MKKIVRLNENDLANIVKRIIKEDAEDSMASKKVERIVDSSKVQMKLEDMVSNLSDREKNQIKNVLDNLGIDQYSSAKDAHDAVKDLAREAMDGEMSEEEENETPKEKLGRIMRDIGAANIGNWGGVPAAILIASMTGFPAGLAISWGVTGLLLGLAKVLDPDNETEEA
jgi:phosphoenolpyruvate carboxylase